MCDHIYITAYWGEWEVMRIITPFVTEKINLTRENVERLRLRCQDLLAMLGWERNVEKWDINLYLGDDYKICNLFKGAERI
ncbi:MAG: hypothetical protein IJV80_01550 [Clostridia bacterium]|nr:hypothetical protein [Clostridia bacterium]